jgi:dipeptidyl aminopeptidase/acylaminoacyl peptidase
LQRFWYAVLTALMVCSAGAAERAAGFSLGANPKRLAHAQPLVAVAVAPDGGTVATATVDGSVKLWDVRAARETAALDAIPDVTALAFSPDGARLAAACRDGAVRVWDLKGPNPATPRELRGHTQSVSTLAFSPDGRTIASGGMDKAISFYDAADGTLGRRVQPHRIRPGQHPDAGALHALAFSPDGAVLVSAHAPGHPSLRVWDARRGVELFELGGPDEGVRAASFSPDGATLATTDPAGRTVVLWETATWRPRGRIHLPSAAHVPPAFTPDGWNVVTAGADGFTAWDLATAAPAAQFPAAHRGRITGLAFSPDGRRLVTGGDDGAALLWDVTQPARLAAGEALGRSSLEQLWGALAAEDPTRAYEAVWALAAAPAEAVPYVGARLPPAQAAEDADVRRLLRELDDERFLVRERATRQLGQLGESAEPLLREHAAARPSPEAMQRIEVLLDALTQQGTDSEMLRGIRTVEVLERAATPEAQNVLRRIAGGAFGARLKARAEASLRRLDGARAR